MRNHTIIRTVALVAALAALSTTQIAVAQQNPDADTMKSMYGTGVGFDTFRADAERRKGMWDDNWEKSAPADDFVTRAQALKGNYRLLAVAIDSCSDSVNTIPYIARLTSLVDQLDLQVVHPDDGQLVMDLYRTPDDRGATPTVVLLDENYEVVGTWVERPSALQDWFVGHTEISVREKGRRKQGWYDWDEGYSTYAEIVALLEAADAKH
jgi:hypothetical protein